MSILVSDQEVKRSFTAVRLTRTSHVCRGGGFSWRMLLSIKGLLHPFDCMVFLDPLSPVDMPFNAEGGKTKH